MRNSSRAAVGLLAVAAVAVLVTSGGAQDGPPRQVRIAVINVNEFMKPEKYEHAKDFLTSWEARKKEVNDELTKIRKKADDLKAQVKGIQEGTDLWMKVAQEWQLKEAELKLVSEMGKKRLENERDSFRTSLYAEARKVASDIAKELKFDLVLRADEGEFDEDSRPELTIQRNLLRSVLYYDPAVDITEKVMARLNEDFKKNKKK